MRETSASRKAEPGSDWGSAGECSMLGGSGITAATLRTARRVNAERLEARLGECAGLTATIEEGTCLPWKIPGPQLETLAVSLGPEIGELFWTATMCDLLLEELAAGDMAGAGIVATEVLGGPVQGGTARALLRWAVQGFPPGVPPLLADTKRDLLRGKAAELVSSRAEGAWAGAELLALFPDSPPAR